MDAKYKRYDQHVVAPDDIHQLLTYAHGYRPSGEIPRALIVHPAELGSVRRSITVRAPSGHLGTIDIVGLDVRQPPQHGITELTKALGRQVEPMGRSSRSAKSSSTSRRRARSADTNVPSK